MSLPCELLLAATVVLAAWLLEWRLWGTKTATIAVIAALVIVGIVALTLALFGETGLVVLFLVILIWAVVHPRR